MVIPIASKKPRRVLAKRRESIKNKEKKIVNSK